MKKSKITPIGALRLKPEAAKRKLINYHGFKPSDFYNNTLICQDCVELSSVDILEEIQLTYKEQFESEEKALEVAQKENVGIFKITKIYDTK